MKLFHAISASVALLFASCTDDIEPGKTDENRIVFGISQSNPDFAPQRKQMRLQSSEGDTIPFSLKTMATGIQTRGVQMTSFTTFRVYAMQHNGTDTPVQLFGNEQVTQNGTVWTTAKTYYWPQAPRELSFWAIAGAGAETLHPRHVAGSMELDYTVPSDPASQPDLMMAYTDPMRPTGETNTLVPMSFYHIFSSVKFVVGNTMQPGKVKSITISGAGATGTCTDGIWTDIRNPQSFTLNIDKPTTGAEHKGDELSTPDLTLMMIPQTLGDNAQVTVEFEREDGTVRSHTASLASQQWNRGICYVYSIGVTPEYELEFTQTPPQADAHYVISETKIHAANLPQNKKWVLSATADDGADVTVQLKPDANTYVSQGFWTYNSRGSQTITGDGDQDVYIFLPENVSGKTRIVTLSLKPEGYPDELAVTQTIEQVSPGTGGWEQICETVDADYGFFWDYVIRLIYPYDIRLNIFSDYTENKIRTRINAIINQYNASAYAKPVIYQPSIARRFYVEINYTYFNNIATEAASSTTDGLTNTKQLYQRIGSSSPYVLELAFRNTMKFEEGKDDETTYRDPVNGDGLTLNPTKEERTISTSYITTVLKKNRYQYITSVNDAGETVHSVKLNESDIVWYAPACGEFTNIPDMIEPVIPSNTWSSTAAANTQAYNGASALFSRTQKFKVRAKRTGY